MVQLNCCLGNSFCKLEKGLSNAFGNLVCIFLGKVAWALFLLLPEETYLGFEV